MTHRTWTVVLVSLTMLAPAAVGAVSGDANTTAVPESPGDKRGLTNATIEVADILAANQTPDFEPNYSQLDAPPGLGADDPWVDANGDEMFGALEMGPNVIRLNGRPLSATLDGDLQFAGDNVCLQAASNCEGQSIAGQTPIVVDGSTVGMSTQGCADGEFWKWTGSTWDCQADLDTTYDGSDFALSDQSCASGEVVAGVDTSGNIACVVDQDADSDTLADLNCASTEITRYDGSTWTCSTDQDTTYNGSDFALSDQGCASGEVVAGVTTDGSLVCVEDATSTTSSIDWANVTDKPSGFADDVDNDTTYDGNDFALSDQSCASGEVVAGVDASGNVACVVDQDSDSDTLAELNCSSDEITRFDGTAWTCSTDQDTTYNGSDFALSDQSCPSGDVVAGVDASGNVVCVTDEDTDSDTLAGLNCASTEITRYDGSAWICSTDQDTTYNGTDFALSDQSCASGEVVAGVDASGNVACVVDQDTDSDTLAELDCTSREITRYDGSAWVCSVDQDTTYSAGDGLELGSTTFNLTQACASDEILKYDGSSWACSVDESGASDVWLLGGNAGLTEGEDFLGTTDETNLTMKVNDSEGLRLLVAPNASNILGGAPENEVREGVEGAIVAGGGSANLEFMVRPCMTCELEVQSFGPHLNNVTDDFGAIGGGAGNTVGDDDGTTDFDARFATVGGGWNNTASSKSSTVGGGSENVASGPHAAVGGGELNDASDRATTVGGGDSNTASENYATVSGGRLNTASDTFSTVSGGHNNTASNTYATVPGGDDNKATGWYSLAAGAGATADHDGTFVWSDSSSNSPDSFASTGPDQFLIDASGGVGVGTNAPGSALDVAGDIVVRDGQVRTDGAPLAIVLDGVQAASFVPTGGTPNVLAGNASNTITDGVEGAVIAGGGTGSNPNEVLADFASVGGGTGNTATSYAATVGGGDRNDADNKQATVAGGWFNTAEGRRSVVGGGGSNLAGGYTTTIAGGSGNAAHEDFATVGGGIQNTASADKATVAGGYHNWANAPFATIGGGGPTATSTSQSDETNNTVYDKFGTISGGGSNTAGSDTTANYDAYGATVGGGIDNVASDANATVAGGTNNVASDHNATVAGGTNNAASGFAATVAGGVSNKADGSRATVGGGEGNVASDLYATVAGGDSNDALHHGATVGGGRANDASYIYTTVAGGELNEASNWHATVAGGEKNTATGSRATVGGGQFNTAAGDGATVPGGHHNDAFGIYSLAAGTGATADHDGTFVWSDSTDTAGDAFVSTGADQFLVNATGGVGIGTNSPNQSLHVTKTSNDGSGGSISAYAAHIDHQTEFVEGLAVSSDHDTPGTSDDFVAFFNKTDAAIGAIEGDGSGGVTYASGGADLAEYFPKATPASPIASGDVVGLHDGEVRLDTEGADAVFVVSTAPAFVGNKPADVFDQDEEDEGTSPLAAAGDEHAPVALMGQVPTKVVGPVSAGEELVPAGTGEGTAAAASAVDTSGPTVGIALEDHAGVGTGEVRTLVGAGVGQTANDGSADGDLAERVDQLETENEQLSQENQDLRERLDAIEERLDQMEE